MKKRLIKNASELITGAGVRKKDGRRVVEYDMGRTRDGAIVYTYDEVSGAEIPGEIEWIGSSRSIPAEYESLDTLDLEFKKSIYPGWVDCHTHLVFAGNRSREFSRRCAGESYEKIASEGGGILATIIPTRQASFDELTELAVARVLEIQGFGVQTIELKSGYGLSFDSEMKSLRVAQGLKERFPQTQFISTFLGAHAFPPDDRAERYMDILLKEMLPHIAEKKLADHCDIFVDRGYFSTDQARSLLGEAKSLGLGIKLHGDELVDTGSAELGVELGALSVDHLLKVSDAGVSALAGSDTVAVLLPGTAFYLKEQYAPARKLIDAGACVALSTDFNPGSSMCASLPVMMTLGALYMGMSSAEIFAGVTYNAAKALGLHQEQGTLEVGKKALMTVLPFRKFEESYYRFAWAPTTN